MRNIALRSFAFVSLLLVPALSHAARFTNQFIEFELPPQWQCNLEGAEWVCQSTNEAKKKDAIIVLAAKLKGDQDSLDQYLTYLKGPKSYTSVQGKPVKSEVRYAKTMALQGQVWVDSLHLESEIPSFLTRYLATVKADIGVLITYSVNKEKWKDYVSDFEALVNTLKVFRTANTPINAKPAAGNLFDQKIPTDLTPTTVFPTDIQGGADQPKPRQQSNDFMLYVIGGAAVLLFLIWRKRRGGD